MDDVRGEMLRRATQEEDEESVRPEPLQKQHSNRNPRFQRYARRIASRMPSWNHKGVRQTQNSEESPKTPSTGSGWPMTAPPSTHAPQLQLQPTARNLTENIPTVTVTLPSQPQASLLQDRRPATVHAGVEDISTASHHAIQFSQVRPKRLLFCLPRPKSRRIRSLAIQSVVSGIFLFALLSVYLGLTISRAIAIRELTVLLLIVIIFSTVYFCYTFIGLCIVIARGEKTYSGVSCMNTASESAGGYALPQQPIRVVLARDEEDQAPESDVYSNMKMPPAYGLWRESVRLDPNRLFWQRNEASEVSPITKTEETHLGPRPPSYASEDGVSYVVDARPRSIAPQAMERN